MLTFDKPWTFARILTGHLHAVTAKMRLRLGLGCQFPLITSFMDRNIGTIDTDTLEITIHQYWPNEGAYFCRIFSLSAWGKTDGPLQVSISKASWGASKNIAPCASPAGVRRKEMSSVWFLTCWNLDVWECNQPFLQCGKFQGILRKSGFYFLWLRWVPYCFCFATTKPYDRLASQFQVALDFTPFLLVVTHKTKWSRQKVLM